MRLITKIGKRMKLCDTINGTNVRIVKINTHGKLLYKLLDMGFVKGAMLKITGEAPLLDPIKLKIQNYDVSIRKSEAALIEVETI